MCKYAKFCCCFFQQLIFVFNVNDYYNQFINLFNTPLERMLWFVPLFIWQLYTSGDHQIRHRSVYFPAIVP